MSDCLTCDAEPTSPSHAILAPQTNPDQGTPATAAVGECTDTGLPQNYCHNGHRLPVTTSVATVGSPCTQFQIGTPCANRWAYPGLLIDVYPFGWAEITAVAAEAITLKSLTLTEGDVIPIGTVLRPVPRPPLSEGLWSVAPEDVQDPAAAESGALSQNIRFPVAVPVQSCGATAEETRWGLKFRKGLCGIPLTSGAAVSQLMLVGYNPLTGCLHFIPNGDEGDELLMRDGKPTWYGVNTVKHVFDYTGSQQTFTVPAGFSQMKIKAWGAGGSEDGGVFGGAGGFTEATIPVSTGEVFAILVGEGAINKAARTFGFGGAGQGAAHQHNGGGLSGVFTTSATVTAADFARAVAIAGGGGAGGQSGGGGNANPGGPGNGTGSGTRVDMQGIDSTGSQFSGNGGGGGGYKGGAGKGLGGYGGSGFVVGTATASQILASTVGQSDPPSTNDADYKSGVGRMNQPGRVVLELIE